MHKGTLPTYIYVYIYAHTYTHAHNTQTQTQTQTFTHVSIPWYAQMHEGTLPQKITCRHAHGVVAVSREKQTQTNDFLNLDWLQLWNTCMRVHMPLCACIYTHISMYVISPAKNRHKVMPSRVLIACNGNTCTRKFLCVCACTYAYIHIHMNVCNFSHKKQTHKDDFLNLDCWQPKYMYKQVLMCRTQ